MSPFNEAIKMAAKKIANYFRMGKFGEDRYYINISGIENLIEFDSIEKREEGLVIITMQAQIYFSGFAFS